MPHNLPVPVEIKAKQSSGCINENVSGTSMNLCVNSQNKIGNKLL